jgi:lipopolysaccharide/colanic/teichoic acid biosynthesis glycosyltransferase
MVTFPIYKFRTMRISEPSGSLVTSRNDSRITFAGKVLRRLKLDELPQLYNVLIGDMSCVGPRPKVVGHEQDELLCKPGLTGAATLLFAHEDRLLALIPQEKVETFAVEVLHRVKAQVDRKYEMESTFVTDLLILIRTPLHITGFQYYKTLRQLEDTLDLNLEPAHLTPSKVPVEGTIFVQGFPLTEQPLVVERPHNSIY